MNQAVTPPIALTIAGSDSSGGAGIQADLKTFTAFDCFGMSVLTAVTAQNSTRIDQIHLIPKDVIDAQLEAVLSDYPIKAIKIGMIGHPETAQIIANKLHNRSMPIILDTPLKSSTGNILGQESRGPENKGQEGRVQKSLAQALVQHLFPISDIVTPNLDEAAILLGQPEARSEDEMIAQAKALYQLGVKAVLLKGGHLPQTSGRDQEYATDVFYDGQEPQTLTAPWVNIPHNHGTGCALASAISAQMSHGFSLLEAISSAKRWLATCLVKSQQMGLGHGSGPINIIKSPKFEA